MQCQIMIVTAYNSLFCLILLSCGGHGNSAKMILGGCYLFRCSASHCPSVSQTMNANDYSISASLTTVFSSVFAMSTIGTRIGGFLIFRGAAPGYFKTLLDIFQISFLAFSLLTNLTSTFTVGLKTWCGFFHRALYSTPYTR